MLQKKVAVVTGSTSGIGLGIAQSLVQAGYSVVLNGMGDLLSIEKIREDLQKTSKASVLYHPANMLKVEEISDLISSTKKQLGRVDILINNAGIQFVSPVEDFPIEKWDQIIGINLSSSFHTMRLVVPLMREQGWGRIINIASAHALVASPFKSAYVAAKHGVAGLTKTVALEVATANITVNAICPGYVHTPLVDGQIKATARSRGISEEAVMKDVLLAAQPTKKFVGIDEVSAMCLYLVSEGARSVNGSILSIDGGWVAQ